MKTAIEVKLKPFTVPNYVIVDADPVPRQEGFQEAPKYALKDLPAETLEALCEVFTEGVFKKAGKQRILRRQIIVNQAMEDI